MSQGLIFDTHCYVCFDLDRGPLMYPSQRGSDLREDINTMVKFWRLLFTDKKYITLDKSVPFGGRDILLSVLLQYRM